MIIATRTIILRTSERDFDVQVRLFSPEVQDSGNWLCRYEIDWPDKTKSVQAGGVDSMQALIGALQMIGAEFYSTNYHRAGELVLDGQAGGYGFPVVPSLRPLLAGDDRNFI